MIPMADIDVASLAPPSYTACPQTQEDHLMSDTYFHVSSRCRAPTLVVPLRLLWLTVCCVSVCVSPWPVHFDIHARDDDPLFVFDSRTTERRKDDCPLNSFLHHPTFIPTTSP